MQQPVAEDEKRRACVDVVRRHFGHTSFRPGQIEPVLSAMDGLDTLVIFPTGAGKSLVFQAASLVRDPRGTCVVVSPLLALMRDQVDALNARGLSAVLLSSSLMTPAEYTAKVEALADPAARPRFLYVTPEGMATL
jgi:ATP-dependent DNA helicase RecQ